MLKTHYNRFSHHSVDFSKTCLPSQPQIWGQHIVRIT
jgi:hypothetical protein